MVEVVLPVPFGHGFDYAVPADVTLEAGDYVSVSFGRRELVGMVWGPARGDVSPEKCKPITSHLTHIPAASKAYRDFLQWVAWYYIAPLGMVLKLGMLPTKALQKEDPPQHQILGEFTHPSLSEAQAKAATQLTASLGDFNVTLLEGVTGSGKTEVYFEAIEKALKDGQQVLVLLPEIALTHSWLERCQKRFGMTPQLWHSHLTPAQRRKAWQGIGRGEIKLVVGARSALFLPYPDLALIVADEEHEASFKQDDGVMYHARDMAITRAKQEAFAVVLASATPSIETKSNVDAGRYGHALLKERHNAASLPKVELVDMREDKLPASEFLSPRLREAILDTLAEHQQTLLFLNRRGYAPLMLCRTCGHRFQCDQCSSWMVLHQARGQLQCHHCGNKKMMPEQCPECEGSQLVACGPGVERVAEEARGLFPQARVEVLSSDDASYAECLAAMEDGKVDILIGTQLLAKGHHFPNLTLVGVVDADMGLTGGDIRVNERTYQLLHQIGGRAGREGHEGKVLMQSFQPEHPVLQALVSDEPANFLALEQQQREMAGLPPYGRMACLLIDGVNEQEVQRVARQLVLELPADPALKILGPAPAPLSKLRGQYRWRIILKTPRNFALQSLLAQWLATRSVPNSVRLKVDIDPYSFV